MMQVAQRIKDICLAVIRVSVGSRRTEFRHRMERLAFELLEASAHNDYETVMRQLTVLEDFMYFGRLIYEVEPMNAELLLRESTGVRTEIGRLAHGGLGSIADIFAQLPLQYPRDSAKASEESGNREKAVPKRSARNPANQANAANAAKKSGNALENAATAELENAANAAKIAARGNIDLANAAIRQSAIVEQIRKSVPENAKLKDVVAAFPGISERTIRYDLQNLCMQGILERVGQGGPATYYRVRTI